MPSSVSNAKTVVVTKRILGVTHTSPRRRIINEPYPTSLQVSLGVMAGIIPTSATRTDYVISGDVEFLTLPVVVIVGTDTDLGQHSFAITLPSDYETNSNNPLAGAAPFLNNAVIADSGGGLQLVPTGVGGSGYQVIVYDTLANIIPARDGRDFSIDTFTGIYYQETPPTNTALNPSYVEAFLYLGPTLDEIVEGLAQITVNDALATGDVAAIDVITGDVVRATSVASLGHFKPIGVSDTALLAGASGGFYTIHGSLTPLRMDVIPAASANGEEVFLSDSDPGAATLTAPSTSGRVVVSLGILAGANGVTPTPSVYFSPDVRTQIP